MSIQEIAIIKVEEQSYTVIDKNITSDEIAFSSFSGMMGFVGQLGNEVITKYGLDTIYGSKFGRVFDVVDGVINAVFDSNINPDKDLEKLIGTQFLAFVPGEIGAVIGGLIVDFNIATQFYYDIDIFTCKDINYIDSSSLYINIKAIS